MIPPISILKIQELSGALDPLDPHWGCAPLSHSPCWGRPKGLPPTPHPRKTTPGSGLELPHNFQNTG